MSYTNGAASIQSVNCFCTTTQNQMDAGKILVKVMVCVFVCVRIIASHQLP